MDGLENSVLTIAQGVKVESRSTFDRRSTSMGNSLMEIINYNKLMKMGLTDYCWSPKRVTYKERK